MRDRRICGMSLGRFVPSPFAGDRGATGSQSAPYRGLEEVFANLRATPADSFVDVGCGKGRVLAYLASLKVPCRLTGVELNPTVADVARKWSSRFDNVNIISGDAFELDYNAHTILFMYRPMLENTFIEFIRKLEQELRHKITLYYYADTESGYHLNDRAGWKLITRYNIFKQKGLYIHMEPQRFSLWTYTPPKTR